MLLDEIKSHTIITGFFCVRTISFLINTGDPSQSIGEIVMKPGEAR